jgi:hypothetical protein
MIDSLKKWLNDRGERHPIWLTLFSDPTNANFVLREPKPPRNIHPNGILIIFETSWKSTFLILKDKTSYREDEDLLPRKGVIY